MQTEELKNVNGQLFQLADSTTNLVAAIHNVVNNAAITNREKLETLQRRIDLAFADHITELSSAFQHVQNSFAILEVHLKNTQKAINGTLAEEIKDLPISTESQT